MSRSGKEKAAESRAIGRLGEDVFEWQAGVLQGKRLAKVDQRKGKGGADYVDLNTGQLHEVKATSKANMTAKQRKTKPKLERMNLDKIPGTGAYVAAGVMAEHYQKQFKRKKS